MKKLRLTALLLTSILCSGCNFFEVDEAISSIDELPPVSIPTSKENVSKDDDDLAGGLNVDCSSFPKAFGNFSTTGLDGKTYDQTMLKGRITLINMWGTYCGPCIKEMPFLANLHKKYYEMDFQVVGLLIDIGSPGSINAQKKRTAEGLVEDAGVTYTSILPCAGLADFINSTEYIPYSVFVDQHGHQLGEAITGGMSSSAWENAIKNVIYTYMY